MILDYKNEKAEIIELSSNEARYLLNLNSKNRKKRNYKVAEYLSLMQNGKFEFNGDSIVISSDGILLDGQHRLMALEEFTGTIKTVLVTGVLDKAMKTIDIGSKRTNADFFEIDGIKNSTAFAAIVKLVIEEFGLNKKAVRGERGDRKNTNKSVLYISYTPTETIDFFNKRVEIFKESIVFAESLYSNNMKLLGMSKSVIAAFLILLSREDKNYAKNFLREIMTGMSHNNFSNAGIVVRNRLIDITVRKKRMTTVELRDIIIYCFRKYKHNEDIKRLNKISQQAFLKIDEQEKK